jgi:putative transcriptional regulator
MLFQTKISPTRSARNMGDDDMKTADFAGLMAGLGDALDYAKGKAGAGGRMRRIDVDGAFVASARLRAGLTQEEFAQVTGALLGNVRKWERGERRPSGATGMLMRILARAPELVIQEAGIAAKGRARKRRAA